MQDPKQKKKKEKYIKLLEEGDAIAITNHLLEVEDKIEEKDAKLDEALATIKERDKEEINLVTKLAVNMLKDLKGEKGDAYIITDEDKEDITRELRSRFDDAEIADKAYSLIDIDSIVKKAASLIQPARVNAEEKQEIADIVSTMLDIPIPQKGVDYFDGKDADEEAIIAAVETKIEKELPKLGEPIRDGLEILKGENRLDISAIKGVDKKDGLLTDSIINRAIGIVDSRTSYLINKVNELANRPSGGGSALTVRDIDGTPTVTSVNTIRFTNGAVTDNGSGVVTVTTGAGGTPGGSDTQVQFNDASSFGGDSVFTYNKTTDTLSVPDVIPTTDLTYNLGDATHYWADIYVDGALKDNAANQVTVAEIVDGLALIAAAQTPWTQNINADGYTLYGNDGANEDLTLEGTSHATKTTSYVILQPTGGNVGIGTTTPGTINGTAFASVVNHTSASATSLYVAAETGLAAGYTGLLLNRSAADANKRLWVIDSQPTAANTSSVLAFSTYADNGTPTGLVYMWRSGGVSIGSATDPGANNLSVVGDVTVADEVYGSGWNASLEVPTKNAIYDKIETLQPLDSDLTTIAGLTATTDNFIVSVASAWASRTPAQVRTTLQIPETLMIAVGDETTACTTGTGKLTFFMPYAMTVTAVLASLNTQCTGSTFIIDINEAGTSILSTKLSIDASEDTSATAASAAVISDSALAQYAKMTIDFDQVGATIAGAGAKVYITGYRS